MAATSQQIIKVLFDGTQDFKDVVFSPTYQKDNIQLGLVTADGAVEILIENRTPNGCRLTPSIRFTGTVLLLLADCYVAPLNTPAPAITSLSTNNGQVGDSVSFIGSKFTGVSAVYFNGTAASFTVVSDILIAASVPSGATTGQVSAVGTGGTGLGPSFTVTANPFAFNMDVSTLPAGLTGTRSGGTFYAARTLGTTAVVMSGNDVYEQRSNGSGQWTFPAYGNKVATPTDLSGWTNNVAVLTGGQPDPAGASNATKVQDASAGTVAAIYSPDPSANGYDPISSVWVKDEVTDLPTGPGVLTVTDGGAYPKGYCASPLCADLGTGTTWRRVYAKAYTSGVLSPPRVLLSPAGQTAPNPWTTGAFATQDATKIGTRHFFLPMSFGSATTGYPPFDAPTITGTTTARVITADTPANILDVNGDVDIEGRMFLPDIVGSQSGSEMDVFNISVGGTITKLYLSNSLEWHSAFKGAAPDGASLGYGRPGQVIEWRLWHKPSEGSFGWATRFNGVINWVVTNASPGGAIGTPTTVHLGSDEAGAKILPAMHTLWRRSARLATTVNNAEGVIIGDSTMAAYSGVYALVGGFFYNSTDAQTRLGILSLATTAETAVQQLTRWQASPARGAAAVKWVSVQIGINDIGAGASAATVISRVQAIVTDINSNNPTAKVVLVPIIPIGQFPGFTGGMITIANALNTAIMGGGGTPITGSNLVRGALWSQLEDGANPGWLQTQYYIADGHNNDPARIIMGAVYRALLQLNGLL